jgi:hypothetical protein
MKNNTQKKRRSFGRDFNPGYQSFGSGHKLPLSPVPEMPHPVGVNCDPGFRPQHFPAGPTFNPQLQHGYFSQVEPLLQQTTIQPSVLSQDSPLQRHIDIMGKQRENQPHGQESQVHQSLVHVQAGAGNEVISPSMPYPYLPVHNTCLPMHLYPAPSDHLRYLFRNGRPNFEELMKPENMPLVEKARLVTSMSFGVAKLGNVCHGCLCSNSS